MFIIQVNGVGRKKVLNRLNFICWLVAIGIIICGSLYLSYLKNALQAEKKSNKQLVLTLEKRNNDVVALSIKNQKLEASVKSDKSGFDWGYHFDDNNPVITSLRKGCVSCPK